MEQAFKRPLHPELLSKRHEMGNGDMCVTSFHRQVGGYPLQNPMVRIGVLTTVEHNEKLSIDFSYKALDHSC